MTRPLVIFATTVLACFLLASAAGCRRDDTPRDDRARVHENTFDIPMVTDPETGCQYLGLTTHGLTPRLVWDEKRQEMGVMGCRIVEHEQG